MNIVKIVNSLILELSRRTRLINLCHRIILSYLVSAFIQHLYLAYDLYIIERKFTYFNNL